MNENVEVLKKRYCFEKNYYDRIYLDQEESKIIKKMSFKKRKLYVKENNIYCDTDNLSDNCGRYYKINLWNISNEELIFLIHLDNNVKLNKLSSYVSCIAIIIIMTILITILVFISF